MLVATVVVVLVVVVVVLTTIAGAGLAAGKFEKKNHLTGQILHSSEDFFDL